MIEIEKKWLLKGMPFIDDNFLKEFTKIEHLKIFQFYIVSNERVRETFNYNTGKYIYEHFFKTKIKKGSSVEDITIISKDDFYNIANNNKNSILKTRHVYLQESSGLKFEFDSFENMTLTIMEVEFQDKYESIEEAEMHFVMPELFKDKIIIDVTNLDEFSNYSLSKKFI